MLKTTSIEGMDTDRDSIVDVTDVIDCYQTGKTFSCDCGHGIGVEHNIAAVRCESCKRLCVDRQSEEREPPSNDGEQSSLSRWA